MSHFRPIRLTVCAATFLLGLGLIELVNAPGYTITGMDFCQQRSQKR